jgi:hypothetical protein
MSTPKLMRRLGPEFKSSNEETGGVSDDTLSEWLVDGITALGDGGAARFGKQYDRAVALAALHLLKMAERTRSDTRQDASGTGLVGAIASVSTTGGMNFSSRDMIRDVPPALKAKWGQTSYGELLIGLYLDTESSSALLLPDIFEPCF